MLNYGTDTDKFRNCGYRHTAAKTHSNYYATGQNLTDVNFDKY